jgi:hypothetical protein
MNNRINTFIRPSRNITVILAVLTASSAALGNIIGSDVVHGDGTVTYSYIVDNSSGTLNVAAWSLEFGFSHPDWNRLDVTFGGDVTVPILPPPGGWSADVGTPVVGQSAQDFLSLGASSDVAIGQSLLGFSFTSKFLPGMVTYFEFSASGDSLTGTTIGPVSTVPEGNGPVNAIALGVIALFGAGTKLRCRRAQTLYLG